MAISAQACSGERTVTRWPGRVAVVMGLGIASVLAGCGNSAPRPASDLAGQKLVLPNKSSGGEMTADEALSLLEASVHAELDCSDCHAPQGQAQGTPSGGLDFGNAACAHCHDAEAKAYDESIHGEALKGGRSGAAQCANCHGAHDILPTDDPRSRVSKLNLPETCGRCHRNPKTAAYLGIANPTAAQQYFESIHGRALLLRGMMAAPSCVDCHGTGHRIFRASDPRSTVFKKNVPTTCGACHTGDLKAYSQGIHGRKLMEGDLDAPACSDCHTAHSIVQPSGGFKLASDQLCGNCHKDRLGQYLQTYHGRAHDLGSEQVAACYDCHGTHDIRPPSDPASTLSSRNKLNTCRKCHAGAPPKFTTFLAHGDYTDKQDYPMLYWAFVVMTSLIVGTFAVWGMHTFMWLGRTFVEYTKSPAAFRERKRRVRDDSHGKLYRRFRPVDRLCHFLIIVSFLILVCTGMPLKFHQSAWAQMAFDLLGGAHVAAKLHRFGAILSGLYLTIHVSSLIGPLWRRRSTFRDAEGRFRVKRLLRVVFGPDSPFPNFDDLRDVRGHVRWFLGRGSKPKFDKFTYWEKFDYFAELWGSAFIGISGLVMWFPEELSYVLPGWVVNLAQVIHSQEALLAAGFILTFHFFNSHFRLEKFPMDTVIFSGRITEKEMRHERARQYERLAAEGRLGELEVKDDWASWKYLFGTFGTLALALGLLLAAAIFVGLAKLWFGL